MSLQDYRKKFPEYDDIPDDQLVQGLHKKYGSDMELADFSRQIGFVDPETSGPINRDPSPHRQFLDQQMLAEQSANEPAAQDITPLPTGTGRRPDGTEQSALQSPDAPDFSNKLGMTGADVMQSASDSIPEDPWSEVLQKTLENLPDRALRVAGGAMQDVSDKPTTPINPFQMLGSQLNYAIGLSDKDPRQATEEYNKRAFDSARAFRESVGLGQVDVATDEFNKNLNEIGRAVWDEATSRIEANQPKVKPGSPKYYTSAILGSMAEMGPALLAAFITKNPNVGLGIMSGQVYADQYGEAISKGRTPEQATMDALFYAGTEGLTEKIPLGILTREGTRWLSRTLKASGAEGVQEVFAEALQMGYERGVLDENEDLTLSQALRRLWDSGIIGMGAGGGLAVVTSPITAAQSPGRQLGKELDRNINETDLNTLNDAMARDAMTPDPGETAPRSNISTTVDNAGTVSGDMRSQSDTAELNTSDRRASPERAAEGDRRENVSLREQIRQGQLPPEEVEQLLYRSEKVPALENARAYNETEKLPIQAAIDADGLKWINDNMGHPTGDKFLQTIGEAFAAETDQAYHLSGDEFVLQGKTDAEIDEIMSRVEKRLKGAKIEVTLPDGRKIEKRGIDVTYAKGQDYAEADTRVAEEKQRKSQRGERADRGGRPPGVVEVPAEGQQSDQGRAAAEVGTSDNKPASERRAEKIRGELTNKQIRDEIDRLTEKAKAEYDAYRDAKVENGSLVSEIDFLSEPERARLDDLKSALPSYGEEAQAAKQRLKERARNRRARPTAKMPSQEGVSRSGGQKEPWQMSAQEWRKARESSRPEIRQSNLTRASGSEATAGIAETERLIYGVRDDAAAKIQAAQRGDIKLTPEEAAELQDQIDTPVQHRDVVEKALREGKDVPAEALAEYPDLQKNGKSKTQHPAQSSRTPKPETGESSQAISAAKKKTSKGTKLYANPIEPIMDAYENIAGKAFDYIDAKIGHHFSPLGKLPEQQAFLKARYRTLGKVGDVENIVDEIYNTFKGAENPGAIYEFLTTKDADSSIIKEPKIRKKAEATKRLIDRVGRALVSRGLLSKQAYEKHKGAYLPRIYLKHLLDEKAFRAIGTGKKPSDMGYLKQRKDIPKDIREVILGEIQDPGFLAAKGVGRSMRDIALLDFMDEVSKNKQWAHPDYLVEMNGRKVSVYWLKNEADRIREQSYHQEGEVAEKAKALADKMDEIANRKLKDAPADPENFKQMPDNPRYGMLRGMYVRTEIYDDIVGIGQLTPEDSGFFERLLGYGGYGTKVTQLWKMSKVSLNPPTQVRNFVSNGILLHLSGVPFVRVPDRVIAAVHQIRTNGKYWRIAKKYGLTASTFNANELFQVERQLLDLKAKQKGKFSLAQLNKMGGTIAKVAGDVYQFSEAIFKTAKIMDAMHRDGMSEADAMIEAQKWMYDYSLVPRGVRYLRNAPIGIPFITFYYKTLPRMAEVAVKHPVRFAPYVAMSYALTAAIMSLYDVDDDDVERLKKTMPKWLQEKGTSYVLPYKDRHGRWQAVNMEYFFPWSMYTEFTKETFKGNFGDAIKTTGILGGPIPDIIAAIKTNKDPFTGRDIVNPTDPPEEQIKQLMTYVWSLGMPPWIGEYGFVNKMKKSVTGEVNKRGDLPLTPGQAMLSLFGVNIYPYEPEEQRRRNISWMQYEIGEVRKRASGLLRNDALSKGDKDNIRKVYKEIIRQKQADLRDYREQTKLHPNLTAKEEPTSRADRNKQDSESAEPIL